MDKILHQLIGRLSHYLQGFIHHRWCRISSINSIFARFVHVGEVSPRLDISDGEHKHDLGIDWFLCVAGRLAREQKKHVKTNGISARCIFQIYASTQTLKGWQRQSLFQEPKGAVFSQSLPWLSKRLYTSLFFEINIFIRKLQSSQHDRHILVYFFR